MQLEHEQMEKNRMLTMLEQENIDLKSANVKLTDNEVHLQRENDDLKQRNLQNLEDLERMRSQIRVQEEAIL
jgi:hypothetical protein